MLDDLPTNFIPLGTLLIAGIPKLPGPGIIAPDGWTWFDYGLLDLSSAQRSSLSPEIVALAFLTDYFYIRLTYKIIFLPSISVFCLRVYHTLADFDGYSKLAQLRPVTKAHVTKRIDQLRCLFSVMNFSPHSWDGKITPDSSVVPMVSISERCQTSSIDNILLFLAPNKLDEQCTISQDNVTPRLIQIYRSLESPVYNKDNSDPETEFLIQLVETGKIPGLKTQLYKYQIQSICKMLQVEMNPISTYAPHLVSLISKLNGMRYFINSTEYTFFAHPGVYAAPRGGILAEDMGLGKSLICIALTAATKSQCSNKPEDIFISEEDSVKPCLSLADYCVESILKKNISWRMYKDYLPKTCVTALLDSPGYYYTLSKFMNRALKHAEFTQSPVKARTSSRSTKSQYSTDLQRSKIWLSCSTLIICPSTLFDQWRYEILKHIDPTVVSTLCLSNSKYATPSPSDLLKYDIILMSVPRFSIEEKDKNSPLKYVHWKRLIIDEGHSMSSSSSRLSYLAREIHAERRWAVSGTPTVGLTRMSVDPNDENSTISLQFSEKQELDKLGSIMENFLMVEPWATQKGLWNKEIIKPFLAKSPHSDLRVHQVLEHLVIRHKEHDISTDVVLPPLHRKIVFLEPSFHNRLAINLFVSVINVNAVTSEREDQDYLFNPMNRNDLKRLMTNLQIASFFWSGFSGKDMQSLHDIAMVYLRKMEAVKDALNRNETNLDEILGTSKRLATIGESEWDQDTRLLKQAMKTVDFAKQNRQWINISKTHEMLYFSDKIPTAILLQSHKDDQPFILNQLYDSEMDIKPWVVGGTQLVTQKQSMGFYDNNPDLMAQLKLESDESNTKENSEAFTTLPESGTPISKLPNSKGKPKSKRKSVLKKKQTTDTTNSAESGITGFIPTVSKFLTELGDEILQDFVVGSPGTPTSRSNSPYFTGNECDPESCRLLGTASSKLSYLVSRLLVLSPTEKCIVFYEFDDIAFYIAEALDIVGIKYLIYANSVSPIQRSRYLAEFHVNDQFRVLLMNVRLASHGLNVSTASRVFFVNPIWRNDIEAQAIKRAHRIGQRFPVYVETLVLRGTMEEATVNRRQQLQHQQKQNDDQEMSENEVIRHFIASHPYLDLEKESKSEISPLVGNTPEEVLNIYPFKKVVDSPTTNSTTSPPSTPGIPSIPLLKSALKSGSAISKRQHLSEDGQASNSKRVKFVQMGI